MKNCIGQSTRLAILLATLALGACNFTGYPRAAGTQASTNPAAEMPAAAQQATDGQASPQITRQDTQCPEKEVSRLILANDFKQARLLLDEDLSLTVDELKRSCILASMSLLAALPESDFFDLQGAQDYLALARVNGAVQRGGQPLKMLDRTLSSLLLLHERALSSAEEYEALQQELEKKEQALQQLKKLTLGGQ